MLSDFRLLDKGDTVHTVLSSFTNMTRNPFAVVFFNILGMAHQLTVRNYRNLEPYRGHTPHGR